MALYLVVWHRLDKRIPRPFENDWLDDELLKSIRTTPKIGEFCDKANRQKHIVYIHRCFCRDPYSRSLICCSVRVAKVTIQDGQTEVQFEDQIVVKSRPTVRPEQGDKYYFAPPP
jgi:hypothetical protein